MNAVKSTEGESGSWLPDFITRFFLAPKLIFLLGVVLFLALFSVFRIEYLRAEQATEVSALVLAFSSLSDDLIGNLDESDSERDFSLIFDASTQILYGSMALDCVRIEVRSISFEYYWPAADCIQISSNRGGVPIIVSRELKSGITLDIEAYLNRGAPTDVYAGEFLIIGGAVLVTALMTFLMFNYSYSRVVRRPMKKLLDDMQHSVSLEGKPVEEYEGGAPELLKLAVQYNAIVGRVVELRRNEAFQKVLTEKSLHGLVLADKDQKIIDFNPAAEVIFRLAREDVLGKMVCDTLVPAHHREAHQKAWSNYAVTGVRSSLDKGVFEIDAVRSDGKAIDLEMRVETIESEGGPFFAAYINDITERTIREAELRAAKEKAESATAAKSTFLAMMSHEVRTPLNGVLGLVGLTLDENLEPIQRDYLQKAEVSGKHLLHILNDLLDLTQIESNALEIEHIVFELRSMLKEVEALVNTGASANSIDISIDIGNGLPQYVNADEGRLRQVLLNLANNAVKFTDQGSVLLKVFLQGQIHDGLADVMFEVVDTGPGISKDDQDRLFDSFTQVEGGHNRRHEGSGLGLAISKRLIEAMGGRIGVESEPGRGSRFWFTLELGVVDAETAMQSPSYCVEEIPDDRTRKGRILVVEDSPSNALVVSSMLTKSGFTVDVVANGAEALRAVRDLPYDLIFMDVSMPDMDGFEVTQRIRNTPGSICSSCEHKGHLPIVALTANAMRGDREKCLAAGMDDFCTKPISKYALLKIADKWIGRSRGHQRG